MVWHECGSALVCTVRGEGEGHALATNYTTLTEFNYYAILNEGDML